MIKMNDNVTTIILIIILVDLFLFSLDLGF